MDDQQIKDDLLKTGAATKIYHELNKLRKSSPEEQEHFRKRWVWELVQNATDCCRPGETIDIDVNFDGQSLLSFSHNGKGFNKENLWSIVTQFSSKVSEESSTGQFGTGFISTTLISPNIVIDSFLENTNQGFSLKLNRSGQSMEELRQSIDENIRVIENIENTANKLPFSLNLTKFSYNLINLHDKEKSIEAINDGIKSLENHVIYLLSFNEKISSIKCNGKKYAVKSRNSIEELQNAVFVEIIEEGSRAENFLIIVNFENGSIAAPFCKGEKGLNFLKISPTMSRLFCNFPLIGTEKYPFPIILNSENFGVEMDRNGIFETDLENTEIIKEALQSYEGLLQFFAKYSLTEIFNICNFERNQSTEYKRNLRKKIDNIIFNKNIVLTNKGEMSTILDSNGKKQVVVPREGTGDIEKRLWTLFSIIPSIKIPAFEIIEEWRTIINNDVTVSDINRNYLENKTVEAVKNWFGNSEVIDWLNSYYEYIESIETTHINIVFPNYAGIFHNLKDMVLVDNVIPDLLNVYLMICPELKNCIIYTGVVIPSNMRKRMTEYTNEQVANFVADFIHASLSKEKKENRTPETEKIFNQMLELFSKKTHDWNILFPSLYSDRSKLRSQQFNEDLNQLGDTLSEKNLTVESVKSIISNENLLNVLLTSPTELSEEVVDQLQHISKNSFYAKQKVEKLIQRSIRNVYDFLSENPRYKVPNTFEEWEAEKISHTVFKATSDEHGDLLIVIRPSDGEKIIFYEDQELSALDSNDYELWTDNGKKVRQLTLGDILKTTNITVIPLRDLFLEGISAS